MVTNATDPGGFYRSSIPGTGQKDPYATGVISSVLGQATPGASVSAPTNSTDTSGTGGFDWGSSGGGIFSGGAGPTSPGSGVFSFQGGGAIDDMANAPVDGDPPNTPRSMRGMPRWLQQTSRVIEGTVNGVRGALGYPPMVEPEIGADPVFKSMFDPREWGKNPQDQNQQPGYAGGGAIDTEIQPRRRGPRPHDPAGRRAVHAHVQRALDFGRQKYGVMGGGPRPAGSYLTGGVVRAFDDGGSADDDMAPAPDDQGAIPTDQPPQPMQGIMRYLTGADAAHPQEVQQIENMIDPHNEMTKPDRAAAAVAAASADDPASGFPILQHYRNSYEHGKQFAAHAADQGDMSAAANAANIAFANVPNTKHYRFMANGPDASSGVTMTVTDQNGRSTSTNLSQPQLAALMKDRATMFDSMADMASGDVTGATPEQQQPQPQDARGNRTAVGRALDIYGLLHGRAAEPPAVSAPQTTAAAGTAPAPAAAQALTAGAEGDVGGAMTAPAAAPAAPAKETKPRGRWADEAEKYGIDEKTVNLSHDRFPWASQEGQRLDWLAKQQEAGTKYSAEQTKAETAAGSRENVQRMRNEGAIAVKKVAGENYLAGLDKKGKDAVARQIADNIAKDRRLANTLGGRLVTTMVGNGKSMDDVDQALKEQKLPSMGQIYGHYAMPNTPGDLDLSAPQTIGAAPTTVSTQVPGTASGQGRTYPVAGTNRTVYVGADGKMRYTDTGDIYRQQ